MPITIGKKHIGDQQPCYIIAEAGVNHNGDLGLALELVDKATEAGADCVKFQTFKASTIVTKNAPKANYQLEVTDPKESQYEMLEKLELQTEDYLKIMERCQEQGIQFLSTPYNYEDAVFLDGLGVDAFKVASGQLVETPFLEKLAAFQKPIIISSGMANLAEVYEGVEAIRQAGNSQVILLQCTTNYPSYLADANIKAMQAMGDALEVMIGYSDHVPSNYACYAAVALGARVIEKHFTLDKTLPGPDHKASLDPQEFRELVQGVRAIETSLGNPIKTPTAAEARNTEGMRRSLVVLRDMKKDEVLTLSDIGFKRPATGLAPKQLPQVIGKALAVDIAANEILSSASIVW